MCCDSVYHQSAAYLQIHSWSSKLIPNMNFEAHDWHILNSALATWGCVMSVSVSCINMKNTWKQKKCHPVFFLEYGHIIYSVYISVSDLMLHQNRIYLFYFSHKTRPSYGHKKLHIHNCGRKNLCHKNIGLDFKVLEIEKLNWLDTFKSNVFQI